LIVDSFERLLFQVKAMHACTLFLCLLLFAIAFVVFACVEVLPAILSSQLFE